MDHYEATIAALARDLSAADEEKRRETADQQQRNDHLRRHLRPLPTWKPRGRIYRVPSCCGCGVVTFDVYYPDTGRLTRYMVPSNLWGSLNRSAYWRGSLISAWEHLRDRWFRLGYIDKLNAQVLRQGTTAAERHSRAIRKDSGTAEGFAATLSALEAA